MTMPYEDAVAALSGPGGMFEVIEADVRGTRMKVFKSTPPSMRMLFGLAKLRAAQEFVVYEDERWSFGRMAESIDAVGHALVNHYGVKKGDRVAIAMRNFPEWIAAFAAITSVGGIAVLLNAWWTPDELAYGLEDSGTKLLVGDLERIERAAGSLDALDIRALAVRSEGKPLPPRTDRYEDVVRLGSPLPEVAIAHDDDATILYTSGTTGHPKGAVSTHRAVLSSLGAFASRASVQAMRFPKDKEKQSHPTCFILTIPLFHVTGCVAVMLTSFAAGTKLVMMYKWEPERALQLVERERVTNFVGVPTMAWDLLESPAFARYDTSSLVSVGGGGAPAPPQLVHRIDKSFGGKGRPNIGYGMTETNAFGPQNAGDDYVRKPTSAGRMVPVAEVRVTDTDGRVLAPGQVGEIWFRGPHLIRGYWNKPEATAQTIVDGWLRTGDIGRIDDEGFVYVEDRAKDMVLRAGENVYCAEVEAAIYEHPAVYECAVFGLPHERLGEEVAVAIHLRPGAALSEAELRAHLAKQIAGFKIPSIVEWKHEALPRNPAGKILKRELRDALAKQRAQAPR
ncbi:MAG: class I adenylate-forming enzyme family protein [Myxococcota bacterium]